MKTKKSKVHTHRYWHFKLDKLLGDWMRSVHTECAMCNNYSESLQVSHILPKGTYPHLRYDPINILPMDGRCHNFIWHANPIESRDWFMKKYPARWIYLEEAKNLFLKRDEEYYLKIKEALINKDIKSLMILRPKLPLDK